jgi:hypothetical protein
MKIIKSTEEKNKKMNLQTYSFDINNNHFSVHYIYGNKPRFEFFHNDSLIGSSDQINKKSEFTVNTEYDSLNIIIWMEYNIYSIYIGKLNGIGIEVNKNPVQHTLADPEMYIKNGRSAFYVLLFILGLKSIITYYQYYKEYTSHIVSLISSSLYIVPLILVFILFLIYKHYTIFALIVGITISILEFIDYAFALPDIFISGSGSNAIMILFWITIRISVICIFFNAIRWKNKDI